MAFSFLSNEVFKKKKKKISFYVEVRLILDRAQHAVPEITGGAHNHGKLSAKDNPQPKKGTRHTTKKKLTTHITKMQSAVHITRRNNPEFRNGGYLYYSLTQYCNLVVYIVYLLIHTYYTNVV